MTGGHFDIKLRRAKKKELEIETITSLQSSTCPDLTCKVEFFCETTSRRYPLLYHKVFVALSFPYGKQK